MWNECGFLISNSRGSIALSPAGAMAAQGLYCCVVLGVHVRNRLYAYTLCAAHTSLTI